MLAYMSFPKEHRAYGAADFRQLAVSPQIAIRHRSLIAYDEKPDRMVNAVKS